MNAGNNGQGIVRLIGAAKSFDGVQVLRDVSIEFAQPLESVGTLAVPN